MNARDYARLKKVADPRWTNASRRTTQKALNDVRVLEAGVRADGQRLADRATANQLTKLKSSVAALKEAKYHAVTRNNMEHILADIPWDGQRALFDSMESAVDVERSLANKLSNARNRLAVQRNRVDEKTTRMVHLQASLAKARRPLKPKSQKPAEAFLDPVMVEKTVDALRIANRQVARTRDLIAENMATQEALIDLLTADVRQQAATVLELLAYGTSAQQQAAEFDRQYCKAVEQHGHAVRKKYAKHQRINNNMALLDSIRNNTIIDKMQMDKVEIGAGLFRKDGPPVSQSLSQNTEDSSIVDGTIPRMSLSEWIESGEMIKQIYQNMNETVSSRTDNSRMASVIMSPTVLSDESFSYSITDYTYPEDKVNCLLSGDGDEIHRTRAIEAADYVCETLGFSNIEDVLEYFSTVKNMEVRVKKMASVRKHLSEIIRTGLDKMNQLETDIMHCLPQSILKLEADIERIRRDGLEPQIKRQDEVDRRIVEYRMLINELWFHLDNMSRKLERCQVPVIRKYQLHMKNRTEYTQSMMDAQMMLEGLELSVDVDDDNGGAGADATAGARPSGTSSRVADVCDRQDRICDGTAPAASSQHPTVDSCRKLVVKLHAKVKACMVHIGGNFDVTDGKQLAARAYFEFNQQYQLQRHALERKRRHSAKRSPSDMSIADDGDKDRKNEMAEAPDDTAAWAAAGIKTREQAKQKADDIVQWFTTPRDTDAAARTRKPISFRKSWIIV